MKKLFSLLIVLWPLLCFGQATTQSQFVGSFDFSGMSSGGTSDFTGDIINFSDQTNQYFANNLQVGDVIWDNLGDRYEVMVINSSTLLTADIDIRDINSSGSAPFGRGFISRETNEAGMTLFPAANNLGISQQLLSAVQSHNAIVLDTYLAGISPGGGGGGANAMLDTLTQASGAFSLLEPGYVSSAGVFTTIKNTGDSISATHVIHAIPDASTLVLTTGGTYANPNVAVASDIYYQADHTGTGYATTPDTARKLVFVITGGGNEKISYFLTEAVGAAEAPTVDSSKWTLTGNDIENKNSGLVQIGDGSNLRLSQNSRLLLSPDANSFTGGPLIRFGTSGTVGINLIDVNDIAFQTGGLTSFVMDGSSGDIFGGVGGGDSWAFDYSAAGFASKWLPDRNNSEAGYGGAGGHLQLNSNSTATLRVDANDGVGIGPGVSSVDASAVLDLQATDKGFLVPRLTTAQRTGIGTPANYLGMFDTDLQAPFFNDPTDGWWNQKNGTFQRSDTTFFQRTSEGSWFHEGELLLDSPVSLRAGISNNYVGRFRGLFLSGPGGGDARNMTFYYGDEDGRLKFLGTRAGSGNEYFHWLSGFRSTWSVGATDASASGFGTVNLATWSIFPNANTQGAANGLLQIFDGPLLTDRVWNVNVSTGTTFNSTAANAHDFKVNGVNVTSAFHVDTSEDEVVFNGAAVLNSSFFAPPLVVTDSLVGGSNDFHLLLDASSSGIRYELPDATASNLGRTLFVTFYDNTNVNEFEVAGGSSDTIQFKGSTSSGRSATTAGETYCLKIILPDVWLVMTVN